MRTATLTLRANNGSSDNAMLYQVQLPGPSHAYVITFANETDADIVVMRVNEPNAELLVILPDGKMY